MMFAIVSVLFIAGTSGFLTTVPENAAVIKGTTVIMKCRTNNTSEKIFWRAPRSEIFPKKIISGERMAGEWSSISHVDNNTQSGQYDLVINSTMAAGTQYVCQEGPYGHLNVSAGTAELVVLADDPNCDIDEQIENETVKLHVTNDSFEMRCAVRYSGNWIPSMEWRQEGCQEALNTGVNTRVENDTVISTLIVSANVTNNFSRYICTTRFDKRHKPSSTTATNVPKYSHTWTSPTIVITTNDNPITTSSFSTTEASSQLTYIISVVAVLQGVLLVSLVLLLLRRSIRKKAQGSNTDLQDVGEVDILQHTGHRTSEPVLGIGLYDTTPPAYATVNHNIVSEKNAMATEEYALYSTVDKTHGTHADHQRATSQGANDPVKINLNIGADGTEYADMSAMKSTNCPQKQKPVQNLFDTSFYAHIDHTASAPPPPPQSVKFHR